MISAARWKVARAAEAKRIAASRVRSKCINCGEVSACIKIEARAPLRYTALVYNAEHNVHEPVDYHGCGPMVEICRGCLATDIGTLARYLLDGLG